ncbi:Hypothetical predicted protein [Octopus vulgaris]|uniref:Uncharacterized protein n=1 Tax=Octopus vulgaris TaxID=6645 RepID=A0AA36HHK0_OCTVU|nr:Hypothetical predicted protein [Octopus vulgaris]
MRGKKEKKNEAFGQKAPKISQCLSNTKRGEQEYARLVQFSAAVHRLSSYFKLQNCESQIREERDQTGRDVNGTGKK